MVQHGNTLETEPSIYFYQNIFIIDSFLYIYVTCYYFGYEVEKYFCFKYMNLSFQRNLIITYAYNIESLFFYPRFFARVIHLNDGA